MHEQLAHLLNKGLDTDPIDILAKTWRYFSQEDSSPQSSQCRYALLDRIRRPSSGGLLRGVPRRHIGRSQRRLSYTPDFIEAAERMTLSTCDSVDEWDSTSSVHFLPRVSRTVLLCSTEAPTGGLLSRDATFSTLRLPNRRPKSTLYDSPSRSSWSSWHTLYI